MVRGKESLQWGGGGGDFGKFDFWSRLKRPCFGRLDGQRFRVSIFLVEQSDKANS